MVTNPPKILIYSSLTKTKQMSNEILRLKAMLAAPHGKSSYVQNEVFKNG